MCLSTSGTELLIQIGVKLGYIEFTEEFPFGEGYGNPLQSSYLENPKDGGAWWATTGVSVNRNLVNVHISPLDVTGR